MEESGEYKNGESGESHKGMLVAKLTEISRLTVREEMERCPFGLKHEGKIETLEGKVDDMQSDIKEGFQKLGDHIKILFNSRYEDAKGENNDKKDKRKFTIEQAIIILVAIFTVAIEFLKK